MEGPVNSLEDISPRRKAFDRLFVRSIERVAAAVTAHWLALANLSVFLFVFMAIVSPALLAAGLSLPGKAIFLIYKGFCHQLPHRSYVIFDHQMAFCQRDFAIYTSMLLAGLAFILVRDRLKPIDWRLYLAMIAPMAVDGLTQLVGWRESNWELRTITGAIFGVGTVWLMYPYVEAGMKDARMVFEGSLRNTVITAPNDSFPTSLGRGEAG